MDGEEGLSELLPSPLSHHHTVTVTLGLVNAEPLSGELVTVGAPVPDFLLSSEWDVSAHQENHQSNSKGSAIRPRHERAPRSVRREREQAPCRGAATMLVRL